MVAVNMSHIVLVVKYDDLITAGLTFLKNEGKRLVSTKTLLLEVN